MDQKLDNIQTVLPDREAYDVSLLETVLVNRTEAIVARSVDQAVTQLSDKLTQGGLSGLPWLLLVTLTLLAAKYWRSTRGK